MRFPWHSITLDMQISYLSDIIGCKYKPLHGEPVILKAERRTFRSRPENLIRVIPAEESHFAPRQSLPRSRRRDFTLRAIVFANGNLSNPHAALKNINADDVVIAANGGTRHCQELNIKPTIVIGDLDSLKKSEIITLKEDGAQIITHPQRKDETDLELALLHAQKLDVDEVIIFAALGNRWDMTLANILLLTHAQLTKQTITITDGRQELHLLYEMSEITLYGLPGDVVSLLPLRGDAHGVTTQGLEYPLQKGTLQFGSTRGVSNVMREERVTVSLDKGLLLCCLIHNA